MSGIYSGLVIIMNYGFGHQGDIQEGDFLLLDGTNFLLLDGEDFTLL